MADMKCCSWCESYESCVTKWIREGQAYDMFCCEKCDHFSVCQEQVKHDLKKCVKCGAYVFEIELVPDSEEDNSILGCHFCKGIHWNINRDGQAKPIVQIDIRSA